MKRWPPLLAIWLDIPFVSMRTSIFHESYERAEYEYLTLDWKVWKWSGSFRLYQTCYRIRMGNSASVDLALEDRIFREAVRKVILRLDRVDRAAKKAARRGRVKTSWQAAIRWIADRKGR